MRSDFFSIKLSGNNGGKFLNRGKNLVIELYEKIWSSFWIVINYSRKYLESSWFDVLKGLGYINQIKEKWSVWSIWKDSLVLASGYAEHWKSVCSEKWRLVVENNFILDMEQLKNNFILLCQTTRLLGSII